MIGTALLASASIFHGTPLPPEQAPWFATLTTRGPFCGGALISPERVITAAHCVQGADPGRVSVRIGGVRRPWRGAVFPTTYREIPSPVAPDDPRASATVDDLAVIVLETPITDIPPVPLAGPTTVGEPSLTLGHGRTGPAPATGSTDLRAADQQVSGDCAATYGATLFFPAKHLCTLDATPTAAQACAGDSGGPVLVQRSGAWTLAAVVTWGGETHGKDCGEGLPDASERVDAHPELLTRGGPFAPYAERRVRVRRSGKVRRCVAGKWHPASAQLSIRWWREEKPSLDGQEIIPGKRTYLKGGGKTRTLTHGRVGCTVTARTPGGWASEETYNQL